LKEIMQERLALDCTAFFGAAKSIFWASRRILDGWLAFGLFIHRRIVRRIMHCRSTVVLLVLFAAGCGVSATPSASKPAAVPGGGAATPSAAPAAAASADAEATFIAAFRQANEKKDVEGLLKLHCLDGHTAEQVELTRGELRDEITGTIDVIEIKPAADLPEVKSFGGVSLKANLKPVATLYVKYKSDGVMSEANHQLGLKNGQYLIVSYLQQ
jgi:hypothetical protein